MTQEQFAKRLGFSPHTVRNWIYHNRVPELSAAYVVAFTLGVTLEYLLGGKDKEMAELRLREIESRKTAGRILKMIERVREQLLLMRPLPDKRARSSKR